MPSQQQALGGYKQAKQTAVHEQHTRKRTSRKRAVLLLTIPLLTHSYFYNDCIVFGYRTKVGIFLWPRHNRRAACGEREEQ